MDIILTESQIKNIIKVISESELDYSNDKYVSDIIDYLYDNASFGIKKIRIIDFDVADDHFEKVINLVGNIGPYTNKYQIILNIKLISFGKTYPSSIKKIVRIDSELPDGIYEDPDRDKQKHLILHKKFDTKFFNLLEKELNKNFIFDKDFDGLKFSKDYVPEPKPEKVKKDSDIIIFDKDFVNYVEQVALKDSHPSAKKALRIIAHIRKNNGYGNKSMKQDLERYLRGEL